MYTHATLERYKEMIRAQIAEISAAYEREPELYHVSISTGNKKIGRVLNVSLPALVTCANCSGCMQYCYDIKAMFVYPSARRARAKNYVILKHDIDKYFSDIKRKLEHRRKNKFFRWHVAGDIVSIEYLAHMIELAKKFPDFKFWTYTKNYFLINKYVREHGNDRHVAIPGNLVIMFSEWRGMEMLNPYHFPTFSVVMKTDAVKPAGFYCPGNCDYCKEHNTGCIDGIDVFCNEH